jgi:hypothetical protein
MSKKNLQSEEEKRRADPIEFLKNQMDEIIKNLEIHKKTLDSFKEAPQFLEIFSSAEIIEINLKIKEIEEILKKLEETRRVLRPEHIKFLTNNLIAEMLEDFENCHLITQLFVERRRSKIYNMKLTPGQLLFYPFSAILFLIKRYAHNRMMRGL